MRPRLRPLLALAAASATAAALGGCSLVTGPSTRAFVIRVDSLTGFDAVSGGVAARQLVWAHVGPNGCYRFAGFDVTRAGARMDVTARGEHTTGAGVGCTQAIVELRGEPLRLDPPIPRPLTIVVHQPDGSTLTRQVWGE
jgi:hypothetical protein